MSSDYIGELKAVFVKLHNCDAEYVETVPVLRNGKAKQSGKATWKCSTYAGIESDARLWLGIRHKRRRRAALLHGARDTARQFTTNRS